ncbi:glycosyltransferase [Kineococcus gypseus]|uniref:glycosyltransferase n=1 Tax=Kineococcus gypseus TaxID=1637102 RepID=UPI003D7E263C
MTDLDTRVRVAYFVPPSEHFAGVERVVHEIASGVAQAHGDELDVHVLFSTRYDDALLEETPYTLHQLGVDRLRNLAGPLREVVAREGFDVFVCPQVEPSVMARIALVGLRVPVFITHLHGNPRVEERDGSRRTRWAFAAFRHVLSRRNAAVLSVSPTLREYAQRSVTAHAPVVFAKNPARELGGETRRTAPTGVFRMVDVARLDRQKGLDVLLHAFALARPHLPPSSLTVVGTGPDEAELKALSRRLGVDDRVVFAGYAPDPSAAFREADCFVLSSRWEGFPLVLLEALRFGLPLLAADCDFGPSDLITDPRIGELVPVEDPQALADGMVRAAHRAPDPAAEAFRRATAASYGRAEASEMHVEVLRDVAGRVPAQNRRLREFAAR